MAVFNEPTQWGTSLVVNGDTNVIPQSTPAGSGALSFDDGFPQITQVPLGAGGIAPDRKDFNAVMKLLGDAVFYMQNGGFWSYNPLFDYAVGRFVVYNNTLYKCIQANGASSTVVAPDSVSPLGSDYWKDIENQDSTSLIPNQTIISELPLTDANLHLKDGALLSGSGAYSEYVDLIAEIYNSGDATTSFCTEAEWQTSNTNYGFCNKFVYDSTANTVRLPKVNSEHGALIKSYSSGADWYRIYQDGWCEQGSFFTFSNDSSTTKIGNLIIPFADTNYTILSQGCRNTVISVGSDDNGDMGGQILSNLSTTQFICAAISNYIGSITATGSYRWTACGYTDISDLQVSPIYEYIVVGTVSKTDIQIDIDNVLADLTLKADKDFSNVNAPTQTFKNMSVEWSNPDYASQIAITLVLNTDVTYQAPTDGYIRYTLTSKAGSLAYIKVNSNNVFTNSSVSGGLEMTFSGQIRVSKGDTIIIRAYGSGSTYLVEDLNYCSFIPCKGAN